MSSTSSKNLIQEKPSHKQMKQISEYFGKSVFGPKAMAEFVSKEAIKAVNESRNTGKQMDRKMADQIARKV